MTTIGRWKLAHVVLEVAECSTGYAMSIVTLPISRAYDDALSKALLASLDYVTSDDYYDMGSRSVGVCWMHQVPCVGATAGEDEFVCSRCIGCIGRGGEGRAYSGVERGFPLTRVSALAQGSPGRPSAERRRLGS